MIEFLVALVVFVFVLGFLVTLHEFGHYYFAKKAGILCSEFAIGMGPVIYRVKKGETYWCIRAIPIGGFVSMAGEDMNENLIKVGAAISLRLEDELVTEIILDEKIDGTVKGVVISRDMYGKDTGELFVELEVNNESVKYNIAEECYYVVSSKQKMIAAPYDRCFESKPLKNRFLTIVAGPVMNLIIAIVIFLIVGLAMGVSTNENIIGTVSTNTAMLYLEEGDVIKEIGGYEISNWEDIGPAMSSLESQGALYIPMIVLRDGKETNVNVKATIQINSVGITNVNNGESEENPYIGDGILLGVVPNGNKAYQVGLQLGDVLTDVTINGEAFEIISWNQAMTLFEKYSDSSPKVSFTYSRKEEDSEEYESYTSDEIMVFSESALNSQNVGMISYTIGISPTTEFSLVGGLKNGLLLTWQNATMIFSTIGMIINPSEAISVSDLSGPIGIFGLVQSYMDAGIVAFLSLVGMLSINLFVVNLLPLPALDGGRLVFLGIEGITKKPVPKSLENNINMIGFVFMFGLMIYVTIQDLFR